MVKSVTFRLTVVVCVKPPLVPWTVREYEPPATPLVLTFNVALPGAVTGLPVMLAVTPVGTVLVILNATLPVKPESAPTLMV